MTMVLRQELKSVHEAMIETIQQVQFSINSSFASATGMSPYYAEKGRHPLLALDTVDLGERPNVNDSTSTGIGYTG
eukprot:SAG11_NODE_54_length_19571_cov_29.437786_20_plen_76_part_00